MKWWMNRKFRMIQNNLRDIDGKMDVDYEISMLKKLHANVVQVGCGGISAFSETDLDCQVRTPYLQGDKFGELVQKCHANGIRVIARFDVSKVHESFEKKNPKWLQRTLGGDVVHYNDTVLTCVNGQYQQEKTVEIISEILRKYPVDGIFFNMFGYQTYDYSGHYVGICQCENCWRRFKEQYGRELPTVEDPDDPVYQAYQEFKRTTVDELLEKIASAVRKINPEAAVSTYFDKDMDIIRCESNTAVDRQLPMWIYSASDHVSCIEGTFGDKVSSNCAINAVDFPFRFMGVSDTYNRIRMYENLANGGNLDWCVIGSFEDYPDRSNFQGVEQVFGFHEAHEKLFDQLRSAARVLLIQPVRPYLLTEFSAEYRGVFRILKEAHIPFDTLIDIDTEVYQNKIEDYSVVIVPGIAKLKSGRIREALLRSKAKVIATAGSFCDDPELLERFFGISRLKKHACVRGAYYLTEPKHIFRSFPNQDWVYQDGEYWEPEADGSQADAVILPYISPAMFGPPERCFGHSVSEMPGAVVSENGISIRFELGRLYYRQGYEVFKSVFLDLMDSVCDRTELLPFTTDAHASLEMMYHRIDADTALLQVINLSGFNGTTIGRPVCQRGIHIELSRTPVKIEELEENAAGSRQVAVTESMFTIDECNLYKAYLIHYSADEGASVCRK